MFNEGNKISMPACLQIAHRRGVSEMAEQRGPRPSVSSQIFLQVTCQLGKGDNHPGCHLGQGWHFVLISSQSLLQSMTFRGEKTFGFCLKLVIKSC